VKRLAVVLFFLATTSFAAWKSEGPFFGHVLSIAVDPANPDRLWVSTHGGGVWRSTDGGATWKLSGKELSDRVVTYVVMQPRSNTLWAGVEQSTLARSKDGGQTWEWVTNDLTTTPYLPAFDPSNPKAIWIPSSNLHHRSMDGGSKWTEFRVSGGDVRAFAFHPKDSKTIWAGGSNGRSGLWKSTDGGASWKQLGKGLPESTTASRILVDPANPDTLYMTTWRGGFKSADGGENWTSFGGVISDQEIESLTMHPSEKDTLFAGTEKGFFKTTDGGESWMKVSGGLPRYIISALAFHPATPDTMWAGASSAGIYKSTDGGKKWVESNNGFAAAWIDKVTADATGTIFAETRGKTFRLDASGWKEQDRRFDTIVVDAKNPKLIHAGSSSSYYRSTDGGVTWVDAAKPFQDPRPIFNSLVVDPTNPKVLYSADQSADDDDEPAIFKSVDGGVTWKPAARGMQGKGVFSLRSSAGTLFALGKDGVLWRSTDGAASWSASGRIAADDLVAFAIDPSNPARMYVAMKKSFHRSDDGGATFTAAKMESAAVAVDSKGTVYVGTGDGISRSSDGGKTWTSFNDGLTNADVRALSIAGTRLYAGTAGGGVFSIELPQ
jgi:photosystem II stability/assembly factor-like uncharacterized protein